MSDMDPSSCHQNNEGCDPQHSSAAGNLLIVEPEELVRWSLVTYLSRSFSVFTADSTDAAVRILNEHDIDAVVIADDATGQAGWKSRPWREPAMPTSGLFGH